MPFGEKVLMGIFLVISVGAALVSLTFQLPEARDFPLIMSTITALVIVAYFVVMAIPALSNKLRPYLEDDIFVKINAAADAFDDEELEELEELEEASHTAEPPPLADEVRKRREMILVGSLVALGVLSWIIGLTFAVPVYVIAMMIGYSNEPPRTAVITGVGTALALYVMFSVILRQPPHFGLLEGLF